MKFNSSLKAIFAAGVMTISSAVYADAHSEVSLDIQGLTLAIETGGATVTPGAAISYEGTKAVSTVGASSVVDDFAPAVPINLSVTQGNGGVDILGTGASANVDLDGNLLAGADGSTSSSASAIGSASSSSNAIIANGFEATFNLTPNDNISLRLTFDWVLQAALEVAGAGKSANYAYEFAISITRGLSQVYSYALNSGVTGVPTSFTLTSIDSLGTGVQQGSVDTTFSLAGGSTYSVTIQQSTVAGAVSVPEPASLAVLGLGLIGLAGASRRKFSK